MNDRVLLMIVVPLGLLALLILAFRARAAPRLDGAARNARRRAVLTSILTALAAAAFVVFSTWPEGGEIRLATLPALSATIGIVLAALAELTWPRPHGERREASIAVRRGTTVRRLGPLFLIGLGVSAVLLVIGVSTAGPTGRAVQRDWPTGAASAGPYPGIPYAVPMALALAGLGVATWWALRRVEERPALGAGLEEVDRAIRVGARVRVLRLAAAGALLTAAGLSVTMGFSLIQVATRIQLNSGLEAPAPPWDWTQNAGFALLGLAIACLIGAVWALLWGSPRVPEPAQEPSLESEVPA